MILTQRVSPDWFPRWWFEVWPGASFPPPRMWQDLLTYNIFTGQDGAHASFWSNIENRGYGDFHQEEAWV